MYVCAAQEARKPGRSKGRGANGKLAASHLLCKASRTAAPHASPLQRCRAPHTESRNIGSVLGVDRLLVVVEEHKVLGEALTRKGGG